MDSSDTERIEESKKAFGKKHQAYFLRLIIFYVDKVIQNEALKELPLLFVANKQDVQVRIISYFGSFINLKIVVQNRIVYR